ncbi:hypothetical protein BSKO_11703 [Bryopsis sp. KO-2023]|nr:hypothetical protein BSKO_11703 [Bryopsis sp. KO-2023]
MLSLLLFGLLLTAVAGHERDTSGPWNCAETCGSMHYNCHQDCAGPECNPIRGNYLSTDTKGKHVIDLIEISAGGYQYTHRGETAYPGTPGECCRACRDDKDLQSVDVLQSS